MDTTILALAKRYTDEAIIEAAVGDIDIEEYVTEKIAGVIDSAPEALNTLNELAAALGDDPNFATTIATQIGGKADKSSLGTLATKSTVVKADLDTAVQTSLGKADTALQSYTETDPTVPAWAKEKDKPTYTASEVGAVPTTRTVNGKALSGDITLSATDVKALPDTTAIPSISGLASETYVNNAVSGKMDKVTLAKVATSGSYNDLSDKPTIPSIVGLATEEYVNTAVANKEFILKSTTEGSTKQFRVTVDDSGVLTAVEIVE
jgi:hypothetical protein